MCQGVFHGGWAAQRRFLPPGLDGAEVGPHALLGPALPVEVAVPHALPGVIGQHGAALEPGGGLDAAGRLAPPCRLIGDRQDVVPAAGGIGWWYNRGEGTRRGGRIGREMRGGAAAGAGGEPT